MDGTQGRKSIILVETKVFTRGGAIINRRGVATDADGNFCIEVPPAGAMSTIEQWDVRNPTRVTYSLPVRLRAVKVDGRYIATPAAPASTFDMMCASGASCDDIGTIQHPLSMNPKPPTCASNASICDDVNSCTTDSCDSVTLCPAGTSCSGCSNAASTGSCDDGNTCTSGDTCGGGICTGTAAPPVGVASGFASPPTLAISSTAMTGVTFEDSFAGAPSDVMWNTPIQVNGGTAMSSGGRLTITDTDPSDTNGPTQVNMDAPSDRVGRLSGAGWIDMAFVLPAAGNDAVSNIDLSMQDSMAAVSARLARRAPTGDAFELQIDGGAGPATATLPAGVVHTLRIERDAAGVVSTTLTPNGGSPVSISGGTLVAAAPWSLSLQFSSSTIAGQTGDVAIFEIDSVTSNVTFDLAAQWALGNSPLSYDSSDYTDADPGTGTKGVLWLGARTTDGIHVAWEDSVMAPIDFDGTAASIRAFVVTMTMGAMSVRATIYSELDETALRAALTGLGIMTLTVDATIDVFTRQADGTYAASLISCP